MVFKKPYAFLIKHFKAIHLVIVGLLVYLAFKVFNLVRFLVSLLLRDIIHLLQILREVTLIYLCIWPLF